MMQPCSSQQAGQQCVCGAPGVFGVEAVQVDGLDVHRDALVCMHAHRLGHGANHVVRRQSLAAGRCVIPC